MNKELLSTKLYIPHYRPGMVPRLRLKAQLNAVLTSRFILISAPAGFGKTSLLSEWLSDYHGLSAWISLDKGDNDPARFLRYLIAGIRSIVPGAGEIPEALLKSSQPVTPEIEPVLTFIINEIAVRSEHIVIILDDYHVIDNINVHDSVAFLVDNLPSNVHVIIATRNDPPLPVARWRARSQSIEIRNDALRFTFEETRELITRIAGCVLSSNDIETLEEKTEGWAAGLQMAALSMQGKKDPSEFIRLFSGSHRYIMDYLMEEVLNRQTPEVQAFLLQTSILERLNGQLCDAVTGQPGSQQKLSLLENTNLFLLPLDDQRHWYRYHHLFADLLQARLQESYPLLLADLHHRAARWYEENDMVTDAINHILATRDYEQAVSLVEKTAIPMVARGELSTLLYWSEQIPREIVNTQPILCIYLAWVLVFAGNISDAETLLEQAENFVNRYEPPDETKDMLGSIAAERAFIANMRGDIDRAAELAKQADVLLDRKNLINRSVLPFIFARAYRLNGDMARAAEQLYEVVRLARNTGNIMTLSVANYELSTIWKIEGKLHQAADIYQDTLRLASEKGARLFGSIARIDAGMSDLLREWNNLDEASRQVTDAIDRMKSWNIPSDLVTAYLTLSRISQAYGDIDSAAEALEKAEQIKRNSQIFPPLVTMIETDQVKLWLSRGNLAAAARWVQEHHPSKTGPLVVRELEQITEAWVLLAQEKPDQALSLLDNLARSAAEGGRFGRLIEILILQALAFKAQIDKVHALEALEKALLLAEPEGYVRIFVDAGTPMAELLVAFKNQQSKSSGYQPIGKDYLNRLLSAFPGVPPSGRSGLVEDLSERELEILRLMARGLTNKQIAGELFITAGTVKAHTNNIYRKLEAANRTQAISLARELKLL